MTQEAQPQLDPVSASFAQHVREFHRTLPPEEQALLEQVFRLAEAATQLAGDAQGFATADHFLKLSAAPGASRAQLGLLLPAVFGPGYDIHKVRY